MVFLIASKKILEYCLAVDPSCFHFVPLRLTETDELHHIIRLCLTREVATASVIQLIKTYCAQPKRVRVDEVCTTDNLVGDVVKVGSGLPRNRGSIAGRILHIFFCRSAARHPPKPGTR